MKWLVLAVLLCIPLSATTYPLFVEGFGALGNTQKASDCTVTASSMTLSCASAHFAASDVGKTIGIPYGGANNGSATVPQTFVTTIASFTSPTSITLTAAPVTTIPGPRTVTDAAGTKAQFSFSSATANFVAGDIGKLISLPGAGLTLVGANGNPQTSLITGINSSTSVNTSRQNLLTVSAKTVTIPGATIIWGTDDTVAIQSAITFACGAKRPLVLGNGSYLTTAALVPCSNLFISGYGAGISIISPVGSGFAAFQLDNGNNPALAINDLGFSKFEIDMSGVRVNTYGTGNKAIFIRPMIRPVFQSLYIHDCSATCLGVDFLVDGQIVDNTIAYGGVQVAQFGGGGGGSCIGIGTGLWPEEPSVISNNQAHDCGQHGIFVESQSSNIQSKGIRITNNDVRWGGFGLTTSDCIGDHATKGTVISHNSVEYCAVGIREAVGFVAGLYSEDYQILNNYIANTTTAIMVENKSGGGLVSQNTLAGSDFAFTGNAIDLNAITGGTQGTITVTKNKIRDFLGRGIWFHAGAFGQADVLGNDIMNCGVSVGSERPGIVFEGTSILSLNLEGNIVYDTRTPALTSFGFQLSSGAITRLWLDPDNDFLRVLTAATSLAGGTVTTQLPVSSGGSIPSGMIALIVSGTCPSGFTEVSALNGKMLRGTLAANGDVGTTGGNATITPSGTVQQATFTGSAMSAHAHELPFQIPTTTTTRQIAAATFGTGTSRAATAVSTTGTANTTSAAVALSQSVSAGTPAGTINAQSFTGSAVDPSPPYTKVIFCSKN